MRIFLLFDNYALIGNIRFQKNVKKQWLQFVKSKEEKQTFGLELFYRIYKEYTKAAIADEPDFNNRIIISMQNKIKGEKSVNCWFKFRGFIYLGTCRGINLSI